VSWSVALLKELSKDLLIMPNRRFTTQIFGAEHIAPTQASRVPAYIETTK